MNTRRFLILISFVLLAVLLVASPAWGEVETRSGQEVRIGPDEVVEDDLYVTANEVVVDGTVEGDLVAFGRSITVNGTVEGDLIAAGQTVEVGGTVEDDARIAGQALLLGEGANVGDDLLAAGYSLENAPASTVGRATGWRGHRGCECRGGRRERSGSRVHARGRGGTSPGRSGLDADELSPCWG